MLEAFAMSDMGCVRTNNEDYCLIEPELGLYVLADGMGGARAGETASRMAVEAVSEAMLFVTHRDSQVLLHAVEEANRRVLEASSKRCQPGRHGHHPGGGAGDGRRHLDRQRGRQPRLPAGRRRLPGHHRGPDLGERSRPPAGAGRGSAAQPPHAARPDDGYRGHLAAGHQLLRRPVTSRRHGADVQRRPARRGGGFAHGRNPARGPRTARPWRKAASA